DLYTSFDTPIHLDDAKSYSLALVNIETYHSFPNVDESNNRFEYSTDDGNTWKSITIPEGSYEITDLDSLIKSRLSHQGLDDVMELLPNVNTLKCILKIKKLQFMVSFEGERTLRD